MSNNTIRYVIYKDGSEVGSHTQNVMCRRCNDDLMIFHPAKDYTIACEGYEDDYYEDQEPEEYRLDEWLAKNPGEFTHKSFVAGETVVLRTLLSKTKVKLTKRRGLGKVVEVLKGKWHPEYLVDIDGVLVLVLQTDIIP